MWLNWYTKQNSETSSVVVGLYSIYINVRILFDLRRKSQFDLYLDEIYNRLNARSFSSYKLILLCIFTVDVITEIKSQLGKSIFTT